MKLSEWKMDEHASYREDQDGRRIVFIEKHGRVFDDGEWKTVRRGSAHYTVPMTMPDGTVVYENHGYGKHPVTRGACDERLKEMGYTLEGRDFSLEPAWTERRHR